MKKRDWGYPTVIIIILITLTGCNTIGLSSDKTGNRHLFSIDGNAVHIYSADIKDTISIILLSDTHLSMKDEREKPYEQYSKRMSEAYTITRHYGTGERTTPGQAFIETINIAKEKNVDLLALTGDIFSYPSERAIEWVDSVLVDSQLKYVYTTGNHDWHYEGMEGSSRELRQTWINNRLLSLYQGKNSLFYSIEIKEIKIVVIDKSTYEISPEQLIFFRQEAASGLPLILVMHIPLYMPGRPVNYGCAHPDWNKDNDKLYELEKRVPWAEKGHTKTTMQFREEVLNTPNLLATFAGHIHEQSLDVINGLPLFVVKENASGNYYDIKIIPLVME